MTNPFPILRQLPYDDDPKRYSICVRRYKGEYSGIFLGILARVEVAQYKGASGGTQAK